MVESGFIILDHPADLGIEAWGPSLRQAFGQAAAGLVSIICDPSTLKADEQRTVQIDGADYEQLLVRWLSEVLYLYDGQQFLGASFTVSRLEPTHLEAVVEGGRYDPGMHTLLMDVKAVTYHQVSIREMPDRCSVTAYLDI